jgi:bisanhydrobacterioruberin hydratase
MISSIQTNKSFILSMRIFILIIYLVGLAGFASEEYRPLFRKLIPLTILLTFAILLLFHQPWKKKTAIVLIGIAIFTFFIEVAGIKTGRIFGEYSYLDGLGIKIFNTPLMIGVNWLFLLYSVYIIVNKINIYHMSKLFLGALLMVLLDISLEPVADNMGMWEWSSEKVPLRNYIAWYFISLLMLTVFRRFLKEADNKLAGTVVVSQVIFFVALNIIFR